MASPATARTRRPRSRADTCTRCAVAVVTPFERFATSGGSGHRFASHRTRHAAGAAPAAAELAAGDAYHLDARVLELRVGLHVALVGDRQPRRDRQRVVAVVPLLALG